MRGPARAAKSKVDYKSLGDIGKGVSFFSTPAYAEGKKAAGASKPKRKVKAAGAAKKVSRSHSKGGKTYTDVVREAIYMKGKPVKGASIVAIARYVKDTYASKSDPNLIRNAIRRGVADASLIRTGGSYRLAPGIAATLVGVAKKPVVRKPKAAVAAAADGAAGAVAKPATKRSAKKSAAAAAAPVVAAAAAAPAKKAAAKKAKPSAKVFDDKTDAAESGFKWQFHDGAKGGWGDYDSAASDVVDAAYLEWQKNPYTDVRAIGSGQWQYQIDFTNMKQTNIQHEAHTQRDIRRVKK